MTNEDKPTTQFSIFHTMGNGNENIWAEEASDYKFSTIDIISPMTKEAVSYPVVISINEEDDTMFIIPIGKFEGIMMNHGAKNEIKSWKKFRDQMIKKASNGNGGQEVG